MLKKLLAMAAASVMMLSCFGGAVQAADYGYSYGELICGRAGDSTLNDTYSLRPNYRAYMRQASGTSVESAMGKYYLYDGTTGERMGDEYFVRLNNQTATDIMKFHVNENVMELNTKDYAGKIFYSKAQAATARMKILKPNSGTMNAASTQTWNFKIAYDTNFADTTFTACAGASGNRNINLMKITADGVLKSGNHSYDTETVMQLVANQEYKIGIVIEYIPTATTAYNYTKSIYVNDVLKYQAYGAQTITPGSLTFNAIHIDAQPWTAASSTGADEKALDTVVCTGESGNGSYTLVSELSTDTDTANYQKLASSVYKYTLLDTKITIDEIEIYAGNKYAKNAQSLSNTDSDFYISTNLRKNGAEVVENYTIAAQTAAADTATSAKAVVATYDSTGKLVNVKTENMTLSADAITETDIELTNEGASKKMVFILDGMSNLKPLAAATQID